MLVYRVEHECLECGPYSSLQYSIYLGEHKKKRLHDMAVAHNDLYHPTPYEENIMYRHYTYDRCGFYDIGILIAWFMGWFSTLEECGFHLAIYKVHGNAVRRGEKQVVFNISKATRIQTLQLKYILFLKGLF
jgi:hypothetical protein